MCRIITISKLNSGWSYEYQLKHNESCNKAHQSKNESALSASNSKKPLYSVPHAWIYSPTSSIPEGKPFFNLFHSSLAFSVSSLFIALKR
jgi:hypothetical protein